MVGVVVMEAMPRRQIRVMSCAIAEVRVTVAVWAPVSQVRFWMRMRLRPRTPVMLPAGIWSGSAGSSSRMPGRV